MAHLRDDFKRMRYNVYDLSYNDNIYEKFPDLALMLFPKIAGTSDALIFKFINYLYDVASPLHTEEQIKRKRLLAAEEAKFPKSTNGKMEKAYYAVATFDKSVIVPLGQYVVMYCKLHKSVEYSQLAVYENIRSEWNDKLLTATDAKEVLDILKIQDNITTRISELRSIFFSGDNSTDIYEELSAIMANEGKEYSPEQIAYSEEIRAEIISNSPYGRWKYRAYSRADLNKEELAELDSHLAKENKSAKKHFKALGH